MLKSHFVPMCYALDGEGEGTILTILLYFFTHVARFGFLFTLDYGEVQYNLNLKTWFNQLLRSYMLLVEKLMC